MPKVTVVIPNYNHARFLKRRITSVLNQTFQDFEVIYLDDASSDDSAEVFAEFAEHPKIRVIFNRSNSGSPFKQWNKGVLEAKGEYVWLAEADDYADERFLETLVNRLDENPKVGLAYSNSVVIDENDKVLSPNYQYPVSNTLEQRRWQQDFINSGHDECRYLSFDNTIPNASAVLLRKQVYNQVGRADEEMRVCGDWLMWIKMLIASDVAFVAAPLNFFRSHRRSVRSNTYFNGIQLEEGYQALTYLVSNVQLSKEELKTACDSMRNTWMGASMQPQSCVPWSRQQRIYKMARQIDRDVRIRIASNVTSYLLRKIGWKPKP